MAVPPSLKPSSHTSRQQLSRCRRAELAVDGGIGVPTMPSMAPLAGLLYPEEVMREFAIEDYRGDPTRGGAGNADDGD